MQQASCNTLEVRTTQKRKSTQQEKSDVHKIRPKKDNHRSRCIARRGQSRKELRLGEREGSRHTHSKKPISFNFSKILKRPRQHVRETTGVWIVHLKFILAKNWFCGPRVLPMFLKNLIWFFEWPVFFHQTKLFPSLTFYIVIHSDVLLLRFRLNGCFLCMSLFWLQMHI